MKTLYLIAGLLMLIGSAHADQQTDIHHTDGTTSTVRTDQSGTQVITPGHGGGQFGRDVPHQEVVKHYTRPGSQAQPR